MSFIDNQTLYFSSWASSSRKIIYHDLRRQKKNPLTAPDFLPCESLSRSCKKKQKKVTSHILNFRLLPVKYKQPGLFSACIPVLVICFQGVNLTNRRNQHFKALLWSRCQCHLLPKITTRLPL